MTEIETDYASTRCHFFSAETVAETDGGQRTRQRGNEKKMVHNIHIHPIFIEYMHINYQL